MTIPGARAAAGAMVGDGRRAMLRLVITLALLGLNSARVVRAATVELNATGSSGPASVYNQYGFVYPVTQFFRSVSLSLPYTPSASLAGVDAVAASSSAWAGADLPLQTNESAAGIKIVPTLIGGTVFVYNLPPLYGSPWPLNLTRDALVGLFNGTIRTWSDPLILSSNPYLAFLSENSTILDRKPAIIVRNDTGSGQTATVTSSFSSFSSAWNRTYGNFTGIEGWPFYDLRVPFDRIAVSVLLTDFSISYTDLHTAWAFQLPYVSVQNSAGFFTRPTNTSLLAAAADFAREASTANINNAYVSLVNGPGRDTYPITSLTYAVVKSGNPAECQDAYELVRYVYWIVSTTPQATASRIPGSAVIAQVYGFVAVSQLSEGTLSAYPALAERVLGTLHCSNGINLLSAVQSDLDAEKVSIQGKILVISVSVMAGIILIAAGGLCLWWNRTRAGRRRKVIKGHSTKVEVPKEAKERTQKELNRTVREMKGGSTGGHWIGAPPDTEVSKEGLHNHVAFDESGSDHAEVHGDKAMGKPVLEGGSPTDEVPAPKPTSRPLAKPALAPTRTYSYPSANILADGPSYQTTLIRSSTGTLRAVVAPVQYELVGSTTSGSDNSVGSRVAAPIAVKPRWQKSLALHITWVAIRTGMDLVATLLNWLGFWTLPSGLLLAGVYAALCVVGSLFFVVNAFAALAGLYYHKKKSVEVEAEAIKGRRRVSIDQMAYVKSEVRRLHVICVREIIYRISLLLREMPLILVALVIFTQSTFPSTYLILGLCSNCIALGFKLRSVPMTVDDFVAYIDMRDLYAVLKSPSSMMQTAKSIDVGAIPRLEADEAAPGAAAPETAEASYYSLHDRTARPGTVTQVLAGLGGLELAPDTLDRGEGGMLETVLETDEEANDGGTPDDPSDSFVYPPSGHEVRSEFGTLNADKESEGTELARTPSADKTVGGTLGRGERVE